jgi:hypothetical protein
LSDCVPWLFIYSGLGCKRDQSGGLQDGILERGEQMTMDQDPTLILDGGLGSELESRGVNVQSLLWSAMYDSFCSCEVGLDGIGLKPVLYLQGAFSFSRQHPTSPSGLPLGRL